MKKWEYTEIVTKKINQPDGFSGVEIKINGENPKVYSTIDAFDVLSVIKNKYKFLGWEFESERTLGQVTKTFYKRSLID